MHLPADPLPELEARASAARAELTRIRALFARRRASLEELDDAGGALALAEAALGAAVHELVARAESAAALGSARVPYGVALGCAPAIDRAVRMLDARRSGAGGLALIGWAAGECAAGRYGSA